LVATAGYCDFQLGTWLDLVGCQNLLGGVPVHLVPCQFPALPLRPDYAVGLEDFYSSDLGVVVGRWWLADLAMEYLEVRA
jgi:hypothetical protein